MELRGNSKAPAALLTVVFVCFIAVTPLCAETLSAYVYPLLGTRISSNYGSRKHPVIKVTRHHDGIDLAAPYGSQIRAVKGGRVVFADSYAGYGNLIVIQHDKRLTTHYGHCQSLIVRPGQMVRPGQIIGTVGSTGLSSGPHLHFEIRIDGNPQSPEALIPGLADDAVG